MTIDYMEHSVWISPYPCTFKTTEAGVLQPEADGTMLYFVPQDDKFFWLGGEVDFTYSNSYNSSIVGIYSQGAENAIFVDSASGCVSSISISATRREPDNPSDNDLSNLSNAKVRAILEQMRGINTQLIRGAFVLRLYNIRTNMPNLVTNGTTALHHVQDTAQSKKYYTNGNGYFAEYYVFVSSVNCSFELENPNVMQISLTLTVRSPVGGFNLGKTDEEEEES